MHTHTHAHIMRVCVYIYIYKHTHTCTYMHSCIYIYAYTCAHTCNSTHAYCTPCTIFHLSSGALYFQCALVEARTWRAGAARFFEAPAQGELQGVPWSTVDFDSRDRGIRFFGNLGGGRPGSSGRDAPSKMLSLKGWRLGEMQRLGGISVSQASLDLRVTPYCNKWPDATVTCSRGVCFRRDPRLHAAGVRGVAKEL